MPVNPYEAVPYPPLTHSQTHPDRLAVAASLLGLDAAPPNGARVLELGCGSGANLIAMAELLPASSFLGVDYSQAHVREGREILRALGLTNVRIERADIAALDKGVGEFDYVIAHGIYSWVPEHVREKLLGLVKATLAPNGVAYVSYNTLPGWHPLLAVRQMMLFRTRGFSDPAERAAKARDLIDFLTSAMGADPRPFPSFLRAYREALNQRLELPQEDIDASLIHDELADVNEPEYFHQFAERASRHGLQYMCEADLRGSTPAGVPKALIDALAGLARDLIEAEQYLDFLRNQAFRRTLLCHEGVELTRRMRPKASTVGGMSMASAARRSRAKPGSGIVSFLGSDGLVFSSDHPLTLAAMRIMRKEYPRAIPFGDLVRLAAAGLYGERDDRPNLDNDADVLAFNLVRAFSHSRSLVELMMSPVSVASRPGRRPRASAFARLAASSGRDLVPNLRHERVKLTAEALGVLPLLDGKHDIDALVAGSNAESAASVAGTLRWLAQAAMLMQ